MSVDLLLVEIASLSARVLEIRAKEAPEGPLKVSLEARASLSLLGARRPVFALSEEAIANAMVPGPEDRGERLMKLALWLFENDPVGHDTVESAIEKARALWFSLLGLCVSEPTSGVSPGSSEGAVPDRPLPPDRGGQ